MSNEKILEILKDKNFAEKILKMQTPEQVQVAFKEKGVEISVDEVKIIGSILNKMVEKKTTNLSEEDLNEIAGGGGFGEFMKGVGEGALDVPLNLANTVTAYKYQEKINKWNPLSSTPNEDGGVSTAANTAGRSVGAQAAVIGGAVALIAAGVVGSKGVKWGYKKLKSK